MSLSNPKAPPGTSSRSQVVNEKKVHWVTDEPRCGSVVMTESMTGTAWQRHYSDGLWHSTTGKVLPWAELGLREGFPKFRHVIYVAPKDH